MTYRELVFTCPCGKKTKQYSAIGLMNDEPAIYVEWTCEKCDNLIYSIVNMPLAKELAVIQIEQAMLITPEDQQYLKRFGIGL